MVPTVVLPDGNSVRLGAIILSPPKPTLKFARYLAPYLAVAPPDSVDHSVKAAAAIQQMYGNNQYGDCVIAGKMHSVGVWSGMATGTPAVGTTQEAVNQYFAICGGGDNGCVVTNVLDHMKSSGLTVGGVVHKIDDYVSVNNANKLECQVAIVLFGTLTIAINLPGGWESSDVWDVTNAGFIGGHDVTVVGYNGQGVLISTWGKVVLMTWAAFVSGRYIVEAYAPLSPDWYSVADASPYGVKVDALKADLALLNAGNIPPLDPPPGPGPHPLPPDPVPWSWLEIA